MHAPHACVLGLHCQPAATHAMQDLRHQESLLSPGISSACWSCVGHAWSSRQACVAYIMRCRMLVGESGLSQVPQGAATADCHTLNSTVICRAVVACGAPPLSCAVAAGRWQGLEVAIKTVIFSSAGGDKQTSLVASEAAIASNLSHKHIVATYSHDIVDVAKAVGPELGVYKFYLIQVCRRRRGVSRGGALSSSHGCALSSTPLGGAAFTLCTCS
jgi:hypothetical protein